MAKNLEQKTRSHTFNFSIEDSGLLKKIIKKGGESQFHFPFEKVTTNKNYVVLENKSALWLAVIFLVISATVFTASFYDKTIELETTIIWLSICIICFLVYFNSREKKLYVYTTENQTIEFYNDKPNKELVNEFIDELINQRNLYLNFKYGQPTRNLEYSPQLENLNWLLNSRVISKAEYDEKMNLLGTLFNNNMGEKRIGFSKNN